MWLTGFKQVDILCNLCSGRRDRVVAYILQIKGMASGVHYREEGWVRGPLSRQWWWVPFLKHSINDHTCGIKVTNHVHERYVVYPTWCDLHRDFTPFSTLTNPYANRTLWDISCISRCMICSILVRIGMLLHIQRKPKQSPQKITCDNRRAI